MLLLGETGVGKSWLARRIHQRSARGKKPFFDINCAGLAPQLLESELFGYERGAFTGATGTKRGLVEAADGERCCSTRSASCPPTFRRSC